MKKVKLCEIGKIITGCTPSTKKEEYYSNNDFMFVGPSDIKSVMYVDSTEKHISTVAFNEYKNKFINENSIVVDCIGSDMGNVAIIKNKCLTNQQINAITNINCNDYNIKYIYYVLSTMKQYFHLIGTNGSTMPILNKTMFENVEIEVPEKEIQDKIANILSKLDDKIKLNNEINNNLYEIMKLNFNQWVENLKDYELSNLSSIAYYKNGLAMQKYRPLNEVGLPVIKIKEMNSGISSETEKCKSNIDKDVIVNNGDVLFAWSGTLCMTIWSGGKAGLNQHIFKVTSDKYPKWFYYFWTLKHLDNFIQIAAGKTTTMGHIKRGELDSSEVLIPNENELKKMNNIMAPMLDKYISNKVENEMLIKLRDTLLSKLMNGEIDLDNIEI